ncbi:hypothetical protein AB0M35_05225 [Micromonospora sp. NPDC051196]|uniref:hypothetical protein n=1 Tax=Micromonospora sp. NPDC051196 TaxID=3155281 RepID=UPI0034226578
MTGIRQDASIAPALLVLTMTTSCTEAEQDELSARGARRPDDWGLRQSDFDELVVRDAVDVRFW